MPSWDEQVIGYYYPSYQDEIYHHGIPGQRWGVRRYRNEDGSLTNAGKQRYSTSPASNMERLKNAKPIGSSARVRQKQAMFEAKIKNAGDSNFLVRNTTNDWRRGRIAQLKTKAEHREAKEAYLKDKSAENLKKLRKARNARIVKNGIADRYIDTTTRGSFNRYVANGDDTCTAVLKAAGHRALSSIPNSVINASIDRYIR